MNNRAFVLSGVLIIAAAVTAGAEYLEFELEFAQEEFTTTEVLGEDGNTYTLIEYRDGATHPAPGEPTIPTKAFDAIIPYGSTNTSVELLNVDYYDEEAVSHLLFPGQVPKKTDDGDEEEWSWTPPGPVYTQPGWYPDDPLWNYSYGWWRGHFAQQIDLGLLQYKPTEDTIRKLQSLTLRINYTPPAGPPAATRWEWPHIYDRWSDFLKTFVLNADDVYDYREPVNYVDVVGYNTYQENGSTVTRAFNQPSSFYSSSVPITNDNTWPEQGSYPYPYVVITNDYIRHANGPPVPINLTQSLPPLVQWKTDKGVPIVVKKVDDIVEHYPAIPGQYWDPQVAIRRFLKDVLKYWGSENVALIGDVDAINTPYYPNYDWGSYGVVPIRVLSGVRDYYGDPNENNVPSSWSGVEPSDLYYIDFNDQPGDWDYDGDHIFGEPSNDQIKAYKPDLACGWIPADNQTELAAYIAKVLKYEKDPDLTLIAGNTYCRRFLQILTDQGLKVNPPALERKTPGYLPSYFYKKLMYESPQAPNGEAGDYPTYPQPHDVSDAVNEGYGLIEIDTHGSPYYHYTITQSSDANNMQVWAARPNLAHGNIYNMTFPSTISELQTNRYGIILSESCKTNCFDYWGGIGISEDYIFDADGGGVAYIGNTRDGSWGESTLVNQEFYKIIFGSNFIGPAETWARAKAFRTGGLSCSKLYMHMLTGEPELNVWTDNPTKMAIDKTVEDAGGGMYTVKVTVYEQGAPQNKVYLSYVCLNGGSTAYQINLSNDQGRCDFLVAAGVSGTITATKKNWVPAQTTFNTPP